MPDFSFTFRFQHRGASWTERYIFGGLEGENPDLQETQGRAIAAARAALIAQPNLGRPAGRMPRIVSVSIKNLGMKRQAARIPLNITGLAPVPDNEVAGTQAAKVVLYANAKQQRSLLRLGALPDALIESDPYQPVVASGGVAFDGAINRFISAMQGVLVPRTIFGRWAFRSASWVLAPGGSLITGISAEPVTNLLQIIVPGSTLITPTKVKIKGLRGPSVTGVANGQTWAIARTAATITTNIKLCRDCGDDLTSFGTLWVPSNPNRLVDVQHVFFYGFTQRRLGSSKQIAAPGKHGNPCCG